MHIKLILFEILLTITAPAFLIAARYSAQGMYDPPAEQKRAGGIPAGRARTEGALTVPRRSPELVSRAFRVSPGIEEKSQAADSSMGEGKKAPIENRLKSLGLIRDGDNIERLYVKDMGTGAIMAVRTDGSPDGGNYLVSALEDLYVINLDDILYSLRRE
jgi:hypothetical protein